MQSEHRTIKRLFAKLVRAERTTFPPERSRLTVPTGHGVYLIYGPGGSVLHVGRTVSGRKGLRQRLYNHLQGKSSFTLAVFKRNGSKLRGTHSYAYLVVQNDRRRALLEAYAVGNLCPMHLGVGKSATKQRVAGGRKR